MTKGKFMDFINPISRGKGQIYPTSETSSHNF